MVLFDSSFWATAPGKVTSLTLQQIPETLMLH